MLLGIDVGGTHTDAVVLDGQEIKASIKIPTDHKNLLSSIRTALEKVLHGVDPKAVRRVNLSTTLSTNAIVEGKTEPVGVLVSSGPGIDPESYRIGENYFVLGGSIDHRGTEQESLSPRDLDAALEACKERNLRVFAAVTKFSTRNPAHENQLAEALDDALAPDRVTLGHSLSGTLNFPRRVATAYFNSAVWRVYNDFAQAVEESAAHFGLDAEINILKADGGTMPLEASRETPVESILSGPAASVMGIISLCDVQDDAILLDIGGTTTDIALFANGAPLIESEGMAINGAPTLVQALRVTPIGIGGDSAIRLSREAGVTVGPDRQGPALAVCSGSGCTPTLTDALNTLGLSDFGDVEASKTGIAALAKLWDMSPEKLAQKVVSVAASTIAEAVRSMVERINEKPVYTIYEMLKGKSVRPRRVVAMGGPAQAMLDPIQDALSLPVELPDHYSVANAIGAARTRTTLDVELFADTAKGSLFIPSLDVKKHVARNYTLEDAKADAITEILAFLRSRGVSVRDSEPEITEAEAFSMVEGYSTTGKNIRVKCQLRPGVD
ncbi:hydantoinase/oxoprolinase family protein [Desulfobaculum bizertense]|uniref:N-methylhydantoinase A/oxoprolinase/acetone carboxylase, beta subunit n=1 Tax=Desulfobaculum bizertense DSM 18034 TaxID=1121442 RepID=A0A1T4WCA6_9BACT|nr:hydantoinase/oxoprolinase family protein [Desulfobaculum bizertense]SKA74942.1 N-methylhydantoinase A/oxoprolinase/acetone carboxylase, beta subunit [Desulfobaculum bizertense DSM 18034]